MYEWKITLYACMVLCFLGAGVIEFITGNCRMGIASTLLGIVQALLFLGGTK